MPKSHGIDDWQEVPVDDWEEVAVDHDGLPSPSEDITPKASSLESGLRGVAQGASMGFADELTGALESAGGSLGLVPDKTYEQARDESREAYAKAQKDNPVTYGTGEFAGGAGTLLIPGLNVAKGASLGAMAGKAALQGALTGLGSSEEENIGGLARDAAVGGAVGGVLGGVAPAVGKGIASVGSKIAGGLDTTAERLAARALGAERGSIKKFGEDKVRSAGRYALDNELLSPLASTDDVIARNQAALTKAGQTAEGVRSAIDEKGLSTFNPLEVAGKVDEKVGNFWRSPINRGETNQLENTLESILQRGEGNIPLSEAQTLKQELGKVANWKNTLNITDKERMARDAYGVVSSSIDDAVEKGAKDIGNEGLLQTLKDSNKLYSQGKTAEELLSNKLAREQGNKMFGLTDSIVGAGSLGLGGGIATAPLLAAKKGLEKYGAQTGAVGLNNLSKLLERVPQSFGKYAAPLQNALSRGGTSLGATHYILQSTDPNYREMMKNIQGE